MLDRDVEALHVLVARVRTGAGHDGAGHDRRAGQRREQGDEPPAGGGDDRAPRAVRLARPPQQHDGARHDRLRQQHVAGDRERVEVDEHGDAAEDDLADDAGDEAQRQPDQVAPPRPAPQRPEDGEDHGERHGPGEQPVDLLDGRVAEETSTSSVSLHCGQSSHPRPEPVSRTAAPVITMAMSRPSATAVMVR